MLKVTLHHSPQYFQFYIQDPLHYSDTARSEEFKEAEEARFICEDGRLTILVTSEFSEIPVTVEYDRYELPLDLDSKWERIVQMPIEVMSKELVFCGCPDGPVYGRFGELFVYPGSYIVRAYFGGQNQVDTDGGSHDFYLVQIWPGELSEPMTIRPPT